jgi:hypothetical protein
MEGRSWWYLTEYDENVAAALWALRLRVFNEGEYFFDGPRPGTITALLGAAGERGTSSILDIEAISNTQDAGVAVRASAWLLQAAFGTATPTVRQVHADALRVAEALPQWRCVYFPVYENGVPTKWCFIGTSGESAEASLTRKAERLLRDTFRAPQPNSMRTRVATPVRPRIVTPLAV